LASSPFCLIPAFLDDVSWNNAKRGPYEDRQNDKIIEMTEDGDEVRNEIDGRDGVGDREAKEPARYVRGFGMPEDKSVDFKFISESGDQ